LTQVFQMHVARYELGKGVRHRNDWLLEIVIFHPGSAPQRTGSGHIAACGRGLGTVFRHGVPRLVRLKIRATLYQPRRKSSSAYFSAERVISYPHPQWITL